MDVHSSNTTGGGDAARRFRAARSGFTLIELVMVVMLMGVMMMAVVVAGYFSVRDDEELKSQARSMAGFLESVRTQAAIKGRKFIVEYDLDAQKYFAWIPAEPKEGDVIDPESEESMVQGTELFMPNRYTGAGTREFSVVMERIVFGQGGEQTSGAVRIDFEANGGSHWHYIYLRNKNDKVYTIEVNPFTGMAEVFPGEVKPTPPEKVSKT